MPPLYLNPQTRELHDASATEVSRLEHQGLRSVAELITAQRFDFNKHDFSRPNLSDWRQEEVLDIGRLLVRDLAELDPPTTLTKPLMQKLYVLGVFPHPTYFSGTMGNFNGVEDYYRQVSEGQPVANVRQQQTRNNKYHNLSIDELNQLILQNYNELVELPEGEVYSGPITTEIIKVLNRIGLAPSLNHIAQRFGGLRTLNEHLGFPNVRDWEDDDFISYGADVLRRNGKNSLTARNMNKLSGFHIGPQYKTVDKRFGWARFKDLAGEALAKQQAIEQSHLEVVEHYYATSVANPDPRATFEEKARHRALWILQGHFKPKHPVTIPARPSQDDVDSILKKLANGRFSLADIETSAIILNVNDDLWPAKQQNRPPIL